MEDVRTDIPAGSGERTGSADRAHEGHELNAGREHHAGSHKDRKGACSPIRGLRVGIGQDVHAFAEGRKLILGGVDIPCERGLDGHSDADVLAHAVADALLGAIREGDIGKLFPDTDEAFKDADSVVLLAQVAGLVRERGFEIIDVDAVIAAQMPKLSPYRDEMRGNLARAMGIDIEQVGVKATTTEHLGFVGREEGIAATAVCLAARCC